VAGLIRSVARLLLHVHGNFLRTPFIIRWPGRIPADRVSNEIGHEVDTYTTFAKIAGATVPLDCPIDGVDRSDLILNLRPAESPNETAHATRDSSSSSSASSIRFTRIKNETSTKAEKNLKEVQRRNGSLKHFTEAEAKRTEAAPPLVGHLTHA
jgi:arylsulfatase A-like enzyme